MDKKVRWKIVAAVLAFFAMFILLALYVLIPRLYNLSADVRFQEDSEEPYANPLMGYAPWADQTKLVQDSQLLYMDLTWAEWEPEEGKYDIQGFEERYQIQKWKNEGKHAVLRFVCDKPGDEEHMDIPQWLYERTGDGVFYEIDYGKGYAPDYENRDFIAAHDQALEALGNYCSQDNFVAFVELGSLGHWGEWHTKDDEGVPPMPDADICWEYATQYSDSFPNARLLMRRNFVMAADGNMGLFNDMTGDPDDTQEWLDWQKNGGAYELPDGEIPYEPMEQAWKQAPVGGEFTPSGSMDDMLGENLSQTLSLIEESHMTFIGPHSPLEYEGYEEAVREIENRLGYKFWISRMEINMDYFSQKFEVSLTWENDGAAPFYFDWRPMMYVYDRDGNRRYWEDIEVDLTQLFPGETITTVNHIPFNDLFREGYSIGIGIMDPLTEEPSIELCMNKDYRNGINMIYIFDGENGSTFPLD